MSNLNPQQFFHATSADLKPGANLVPPARRGINFEHPENEMWRNHRVFAAKNPDNAAAWREHDPNNTKVYEVHMPTARRLQGSDYDWMGAPHDHAADDQYIGHGARVLRRLNPDEFKNVTHE